MAALRRDVAGTANAANTANTADTGTASCGGSIGTGSTGTGSISTGSTGTAASGSTSDPAFSVVSAEDLHAALAKVTPSAMREVVVEVPEVRWSDIGGKHRRLVAGILVQLNASLTHILSKLSLQTLSPNSLSKLSLQTLSANAFYKTPSKLSPNALCKTLSKLSPFQTFSKLSPNSLETLSLSLESLSLCQHTLSLSLSLFCRATIGESSPERSRGVAVAPAGIVHHHGHPTTQRCAAVRATGMLQNIDGQSSGNGEWNELFGRQGYGETTRDFTETIN
jgi:hypothetical protein